MQINLKETADFLKAHDNFYILTHQSPDGDTMGSGFGLCCALRKIGKKANVLCSDNFPKRYHFMYEGYVPQKFAPETIVAVDVADKKLLGPGLAQYGDYVDLCIDHHISNTLYAERLLVYPDAAAACEVIFRVLAEMDVTLDRQIAECLYTGIATDTGCFKYANTTKLAHIISAKLMDCGIRLEQINREMFDIKSKARLKVEQYINSSMEYYLDDKCAMAAVTLDTLAEAGLPAEEFEGIAGMSVQLEGVKVGVIIKEKEAGKFKISMRSASDIDVSEICRKFGGGGHVKAAGCAIDGTLDDVKLKLLSGIAPALGIDLWLA
ncbi:MAG: bifunctional oligoribonuclease/PAP phosphatase NrnA [Oscillospiraceae bacterium]|nr:bifunctional oligoribonuclease/PAP phosphatase NrnA [Oscillospiraceae bacterium]